MKKEMIKQIKKERAIESGQNYFDGVKDSLKRALIKVERNEKHWKEAINNDNYLPGAYISNNLKINKIEWTVDYLRQINLQQGVACKASAQLAVAFDIDI